MGSWEGLVNFRKGLEHQLKRATKELEDLNAATAEADRTKRAWAYHRLRWVKFKIDALDGENRMIHDKPSWGYLGSRHGGKWLSYGSTGDDAVRDLTDEEA